MQDFLQIIPLPRMIYAKKLYNSQKCSTFAPDFDNQLYIVKSYFNRPW